VAATTDIRGERQILLSELQNQQQAIMQSINATTEKAIQDIDSRSRSLIDHFFVRAFELVLFTLALCALIGWILLRRFASIRPQRDKRLYDRAA
jgi:hypothetical protein